MARPLATADNDATKEETRTKRKADEARRKERKKNKKGCVKKCKSKKKTNVQGRTFNKSKTIGRTRGSWTLEDRGRWRTRLGRSRAVKNK